MVKISNILNTLVFFSYFRKKSYEMKHFNTTVEPTKNENIVKFVINSIISQAKSYEFTNIDTAKPSPLAQELFSLPFVKTIFISQNFIAIEKFTSENVAISWKDVQDDVANSITDYLNSGKPVITDTPEGNKIPVTIYAENTPNPEVMKFVANKKLATRIYEFKSAQEAKHAPLAQSLFIFRQLRCKQTNKKRHFCNTRNFYNSLF